jgi:hypothetical protein
MPNKVVSSETLKWICLRSLYAARSAVSAAEISLLGWSPSAVRTITTKSVGRGGRVACTQGGQATDLYRREALVLRLFDEAHTLHRVPAIEAIAAPAFRNSANQPLAFPIPQRIRADIDDASGGRNLEQ